ncbi:dTDP-4-dehydrorhamnose reductase [Francisella tularensis subsp. novicida]|uniref:dTDP-4-dehydrorhamnose reductase n=1 Tax=Francisella tularensis TaxID=263 RepID=UPI000CE29CDB|nr:dTDP-4-dehydrorhamnose reductase [Francisella tularensis]AVC43808.1 dTDP-4-dehydrorhamnose reductase [Francisella tularensis subsp. novicida]
MKVLVTGGNGQLGSELRELVNISREIPEQVGNDIVSSHPELDSGSHNSFEYIFTHSKSLDITDHQAVERFIIDNSIGAIINCAAYTAVDKAESDIEMADKINHLAVVNMVELAKKYSMKLIHISTDYVFDGKNYKPYLETDITNPQSVYGITKLAGEKAIQEINPKNSIIIRTSWVYSYYGNNFVKTMLCLGQNRDSLDVIFDQVGSPTYAKDLAKVILDILPAFDKSDSEFDLGSHVEIYNYSNEGVLSWYDFAKEIMDIANINCQVNPIETAAYPTPAKRPHYSLLNKNKIKEDFGISIPYWKVSLKECIDRILNDKY